MNGLPLIRELADYFEGNSDGLLDTLAGPLRPGGGRSFFERDLFNGDLLLLQAFYERQARRRAREPRAPELTVTRGGDSLRQNGCYPMAACFLGSVLFALGSFLWVG